MNADLSLLALHTRMAKVEIDAASMAAWRRSIEESTEVQRELVQVGQNILKAMGWIGSAAKWIVVIAAAVKLTWMAVKEIRL